jgi:hypothetical protein
MSALMQSGPGQATIVGRYQVCESKLPRASSVHTWSGIGPIRPVPQQ